MIRRETIIQSRIPNKSSSWLRRMRTTPTMILPIHSSTSSLTKSTQSTSNLNLRHLKASDILRRPKTKPKVVIYLHSIASHRTFSSSFQRLKRTIEVPISLILKVKSIWFRVIATSQVEYRQRQLRTLQAIQKQAKPWEPLSWNTESKAIPPRQTRSSPHRKVIMTVPQI